MLYASRRGTAIFRISLAAAASMAWLTLASSSSAQEPCFERLDNGVDMTGWTRSTTNHHGPGLGWTVEDGAMTGRQTAGNLGGIMMTNKTYKDVEVIWEVKIDWGCDSGMFFRTTAGDRAYQVNVDHLEGAGVGTIYGEGFTTELRARDYTLTNNGSTAIVEPGHTPIFDLAKWPMIWHPTEFNTMRARVEGNPPHIQVWISDTKVMDFTDTMLRSEINPSGPLAIQVHMGPDRWVAGGAVKFRNIRAKDLTVACATQDDAGGAQPGQPDAAAGGVDASSTGIGGSGSMPSDSGATMNPIIPVDAASGTGGSAMGSAGEGDAAAVQTSGCACATVRSSRASGALTLILLGVSVLLARRS